MGTSSAYARPTSRVPNDANNGGRFREQRRARHSWRGPTTLKPAQHHESFIRELLNMAESDIKLADLSCETIAAKGSRTIRNRPASFDYRSAEPSIG